MNGLSFDTLSRFAAEAIPDRAQGRRRVTAAFAPRAQSLTAEAKNKKKRSKRKARKKAEQQCKNQVAECTTAIIGLCNGRPECLAVGQQCCPLLGSCNATAFIDCIIL
jgi:hypothetical protein